MPKFSIITTTYKHERFITQTIDSLLNQSISDWELLIGDDSPDGATWDIIEWYTQKYPDKIRTWQHAMSKGIVENMNFLISQVCSDSEYIAFLEGDDVYAPDCLKKKLEVFEKYSEVALVYSDMNFINADWKVTLEKRIQSNGTRFYQNEIIPVESYINTKNSLIISYSTVAIRKDVLYSFSPIEAFTQSKMYSVSDYDLFFRIATRYPVYGISDALTLYRRHTWNASSGYNTLFQDLHILLDTYSKRWFIPEKVYKKKVSWILIMQSIVALSKWEKMLALSYCKRAVLQYPFQDWLYRWGVLMCLILPVKLVQNMLVRKMRTGV